MSHIVVMLATSPKEHISSHDTESGIKKKKWPLQLFIVQVDVFRLPVLSQQSQHHQLQYHEYKQGKNSKS